MFTITAELKPAHTDTSAALERAKRVLSYLQTQSGLTQTNPKQISLSLTSSHETLKAIKLLANLGTWDYGLGISIQNPDRTQTNSIKALEKAKKHGSGFALNTGKKNEIASSLEALIRTKIMLISGRTERQKQIIALREQHASATETAEVMEVSKAAISKVLKAANWDLEKGTDLLAIRLLSGLGV